jgi:L-ascorbate metabolism protein UlaG (beta-lactamase superfamily)
VGTIVTTVPGAKRLAADPAVAGGSDADGSGPEIRGLAAWDTTRLEAPDKTAIEIVATPCRHGPPLTHPIVGEVVGFALTWEGQANGALWISGDTVLYDGVREVADRVDVGTALIHLGGVQFPISGPLRYTMTGADAAELCAQIRPNTAIPIHYEGWKHFREGRGEVEADLTAAPEDVRALFRWLPIGSATAVDV